jgi:endonuclease/exonuclease/phosphatase family metal-dependent hydrolase
MLRVVTLNIWGNHSPWATRRQLIRQELARLSPDVVALQEVLRPLGPGTSQADELAEGLPYRVCFGRACAIEKPFPAEFGNAALIKQPLREQRLLKLPTPPDRETRSALYVLLSMKVGLLPVVVTHLSWEPELAETRGAAAWRDSSAVVVGNGSTAGSSSAARTDLAAAAARGSQCAAGESRAGRAARSS